MMTTSCGPKTHMFNIQNIKKHWFFRLENYNALKIGAGQKIKNCEIIRTYLCFLKCWKWWKPGENQFGAQNVHFRQSKYQKQMYFCYRKMWKIDFEKMCTRKSSLLIFWLFSKLFCFMFQKKCVLSLIYLFRDYRSYGPGSTITDRHYRCRI